MLVRPNFPLPPLFQFSVQRQYNYPVMQRCLGGGEEGGRGGGGVGLSVMFSVDIYFFFSPFVLSS